MGVTTVLKCMMHTNKRFVAIDTRYGALDQRLNESRRAWKTPRKYVMNDHVVHYIIIIIIIIIWLDQYQNTKCLGT